MLVFPGMLLFPYEIGKACGLAGVMDKEIRTD
jgi:hypothetical protein